MEIRIEKRTTERPRSSRAFGHQSRSNYGNTVTRITWSAFVDEKFIGSHRTRKGVKRLVEMWCRRNGLGR